MLGLADWDIKSNLLGLLNDNALGEANGDLLRLTDGDLEGDLLWSLDCDALGVADRICWVLQMGTL